MNRRDYFQKWREGLLELDDRELGVYLLHHNGPVVDRRVPSLEINNLELYERLWPTFSKERWNERVGKIDKSYARRRLQFINPEFKSKKEKERYESAALALGQRARALLTRDRAALWNVASERRAALENALEHEERWAVEAEQRASELRTRAENTRTELNAVLAELAELT